MSKNIKPGLTTGELKKYEGFENMNEKQLQEALNFIEQFTEVLMHVSMKEE